MDLTIFNVLIHIIPLWDSWRPKEERLNAKYVKELDAYLFRNLNTFKGLAVGELAQGQICSLCEDRESDWDLPKSQAQVISTGPSFLQMGKQSHRKIEDQISKLSETSLMDGISLFIHLSATLRCKM